MKSRQFIDIDSKDQPIYRVFSYRRLIELFMLKELVLVKPECWDDPFENFLRDAEVEMTLSHRKGKIGNLAPNIFGQCWTLKKESDAMWRIYSKNKDGGKVKTTSRRLLNAIYDSENPDADDTYFIGKVEYKSEEQIRNLFSDPEQLTKKMYTDLNRFAIQVLLIKRPEFQHEEEIRLIYRAKPDDASSSEKIAKFKIDPNNLFDEVVLDPRLGETSLEEIIRLLRKAGYSGDIRRSTLYQVPNLQVKLNR